MASSATATPDTLITLKINFDGASRRIKLPLRDLGASSLEDKLRFHLQIPLGRKAVFERYSDSAATYVVLDPSNISVYKQLYRAAKAKQKLKLRVSTTPEPDIKQEPEPEPKLEAQAAVEVDAKVQEAKGPKPVTVEDEPETEPSVEKKPDHVPATSTPRTFVPSPIGQASHVPTPNVAAATRPVGTIATVVAPQSAADFPEFIKQWRARGMPRIHLRRDDKGVEVIDFCDANSPLDPYFSNKTGSNPHPFLETFAGAIRSVGLNDVPASDKAEEKKPLIAPETTQKNCEFSGLCTRSRRPPFTVCCNSCDKSIPDAHFHCSTCDDGDFDLCQDCVNQGITCYDDNHWLIKRTINSGQITYSTTQVAPKTNKSMAKSPGLLQQSSPVQDLLTKHADKPTTATTTQTWDEKVVVPTPAYSSRACGSTRTCNGCVLEFPEKEFLHCTTCPDFDLCRQCFADNQHGHHPKHGFTPAVPDTVFDGIISFRLSPGRDIAHSAICDGCDKYIRGVRHKCLDCPDWDYCSECVANASFIHPNHRFVALYEPIPDRSFRSVSRSTHVGICCDGPLCNTSRSGQKYIVGDRYKCAVCHDLDFCANCEASPANTHNKTHPLIKFRTPVRHVSVTTTGEHEDGQRLPAMGDRHSRHRTSNRSTETVPLPSLRSFSAGNTVNSVQTIVDVKPTEPQQSPEPAKPVEVQEEKSVQPEEVPEVKPTQSEQPAMEKKEPVPDLIAIFKHDTVEDGTVMPPNHTFEQTWVLKNSGQVAWPAGCSVKFVGGDYMGAVDPKHPAGVHELVSASESTVCYNQLQPGQEFPFTVLMRTPDREGKVISYWRLTTSDGIKFGHKLWCDVTVQYPPPKAKEVESLLDSKVPDLGKSQVIVPKLDHESPASSVHVGKTATDTETETETLAPSVDDEEDDFEDCAEDDAWVEESDSGFLTDEEYDILDASDEEYLSEQHKKVWKR